MDFKYILKVFIIVFIIIAFIVFINSIGFNLNEYIYPKKTLQFVTVEGLELPNTDIPMNKSQAFCEVHKGSLVESCGKLTRGNCNDISCCVFIKSVLPEA